MKKSTKREKKVKDGRMMVTIPPGVEELLLVCGRNWAVVRVENLTSLPKRKKV